MNQIIDDKTTDSRWKSLYKVGGLAALIAAVLLLTEIIVFTIWPQPNTVTDYFVLFQNSTLIGLLDFYLLEFFVYVLFIPIFFAIYVAIRRANESYMLLVLTTNYTIFNGVQALEERCLDLYYLHHATTDPGILPGSGLGQVLMASFFWVKTSIKIPVFDTCCRRVLKPGYVFPS